LLKKSSNYQIIKRGKIKKGDPSARLGLASARIGEICYEIKRKEGWLEKLRAGVGEK